MRGKTTLIEDTDAAFPRSHCRVNELNGDATVITAVGLSKRLLIAALIAGGNSRKGEEIKRVASDSLALADELLIQDAEDTADSALFETA